MMQAVIVCIFIVRGLNLQATTLTKADVNTSVPGFQSSGGFLSPAWIWYEENSWGNARVCAIGGEDFSTSSSVSMRIIGDLWRLDINLSVGVGSDLEGVSVEMLVQHLVAGHPGQTVPGPQFRTGLVVSSAQGSTSSENYVHSTDQSRFRIPEPGLQEWIWYWSI